MKEYSSYQSSNSFEDWASDLGFDTDSRRALACYEATRETALSLERVFGSQALEALAEIEF